MTGLPPAVARGVREALGPEAGEIRGSSPVGGGCINPAARVELADGTALFVKWNSSAPPDMFAAEADGLRALARADALRVPAVMGIGSDPGGPGWLLLEYVARGVEGPSWGPALGRGLLALHSSGGDRWGWARPNYIGALDQSNTEGESWPEFWRTERLLPQVRLAADSGRIRESDADELDRLMERTDELLEGAEEDGPSLLHGDLWGGNVFPCPGGDPVLIDPAVYRGHREVDLAMSELFGGFPESFYRAYHEAWPVAPAYRAVRRDVYQLYYLLVHVNLFGGSYVASAMACARRALQA